MSGWSKHEGTAVALPLSNLDTDQLLPARFMSTPRSEGYGRFLLYDLRRDENGSLKPDFPLNQTQDTGILVSGRNFGCGSSREAAVYALLNAGIRAVIAPGFGDIFANNAINNGLLPAVVSREDHKKILQRMGAGPLSISIDIETRTLAAGDVEFSFMLEEGAKTKLINGWDEIDLTGQYAERIREFKKLKEQTAPWAWPGKADCHAPR